MKKSLNSNARSIVFLLFIVATVLEFITPVAYVFGYLYIIPILSANTCFSQRQIWGWTGAACGLTILNLFVPQFHLNFSGLINRLIVVIALVITTILVIANRRYQKATMAQKTLLESQAVMTRMREDFVSTLTHDLKTPLLGAIETINYFHQGQFGPVTSLQEKVLDKMTVSHQSSLQLLETLLDIYRNDIEGLKLHCQPVELNKLVESTIFTLTELALSRRVYLSFNYGDSNFRHPAFVDGDSLQLQRVFTNLITNAINHSPRSEKVEVILETQNNYHIIKVSDRGSGIADEELPNLFQRFYQGNSHRQAKGSGLGLYLSRQIINAHQGEIWAENAKLGGSIFAFKLPVYYQISTNN